MILFWTQVFLDKCSLYLVCALHDIEGVRIPCLCIIVFKCKSGVFDTYGSWYSSNPCVFSPCVYATPNPAIHLIYMSFLINFQISGVSSGFGHGTGWTGSVTETVRLAPICSPSTTDSGLFPVMNRSTERVSVPGPAGPVWWPVSSKTVQKGEGSGVTWGFFPTSPQRPQPPWPPPLELFHPSSGPPPL